MMRYGNPLSPKYTDPTFLLSEEAVEAAIKHQRENPDVGILAVYYMGETGFYVEYLIFECRAWQQI